MTDREKQNNPVTDFIAGSIVFVGIAGGFLGEPPLEQSQAEHRPQLSQIQKREKPHIYPSLTHGMTIESQLEEAYTSDLENKRKEQEEDEEIAQLNKSQPKISNECSPDS